MITRYEIKKRGNEEVLYLYMNYNYEFAQELGSPNKKITILSEVKNYIDKMKIKFKGKYIVLVIAGLAAITLAYSTDKWSEEKNSFIPNPNTVEIVNYQTHLNTPIQFEEKEEDTTVKVEPAQSIKPQETPSKPMQNSVKPTPSPSTKPTQSSTPASKPTQNTTQPSASNPTPPPFLHQQ